VSASRRLSALAALTLLAGCATPTLQGRAALSRGDYGQAAEHFEESLAREPGRVSDLVGLGIAHYKLDALDDARGAFEQALAAEPDAQPPHLYLALIAIRVGDASRALEHLDRFVAMGVPVRLAGQIERTRRALSEPLTADLRAYVAGSLEDAYQWAGEVAGALQAAREAEWRRLSDQWIYLSPRYYCRCR
jgi:tetratricopeptide (TPR) repeat protein